MEYKIIRMKYDKIRNAMAVNCKFTDDLKRDYTYFFFVRISETETNLDIKNKIEYGIMKIKEIYENVNNNDILISHFLIQGDINKNKVSVNMEVIHKNNPRKRAIILYKDKNQLNNDINKTVAFFSQQTAKEKLESKIQSFRNYIGG